MDMYYCTNCGRWVEDLKEYRECVGEFWGAPAYETFWCCPHCGSDEVLDRDEYEEYMMDDIEREELDEK